MIAQLELVLRAVTDSGQVFEGIAGRVPQDLYQQEDSRVFASLDNIASGLSENESHLGVLFGYVKQVPAPELISRAYSDLQSKIRLPSSIVPPKT